MKSEKAPELKSSVRGLFAFQAGRLLRDGRFSAELLLWVGISMRAVKKGLSGGLLLVCMILGSTSVARSGEISFDELYRLLMIGHWVQVSEVYAVSEFSSSMLYKADIYRSEHMQERLASLEGVWRVENGRLIIRLTQVAPASLPVGSVFVEKIHLVNGRKLVLIDEKGTRYTKLRLRN